PISSHNSLALRLSLLVRQVLLTLATAAALIFGAIALGLILFTLQQGLVRGWQKISPTKLED
ncbi:MAG: DUF3082 domain-containing protein, partial [Pseudanabaenaceae cyanobacterium bins.68]|nr:DUF3082 domain-containing protein [Pseudanabaenaceae cyanobacterium bins.68]